MNLLRALLLVGLVTPSASAAPLVTADFLAKINDGEPVPAIVMLRSSDDRFDRRVRHRDELIASTRLESRTRARWSMISGFAATIDRETFLRLQESPHVASIELDLPGIAATLESAPLIGAPSIRLLGYDGTGVTVAIIDTGVNANHPDLRGKVVAERCYCRDTQNRGCCPNGAGEQAGPGSAADAFGHGTTVAGIVASAGTVSPQGVAPGASIVAIRVAEANGSFTWTSQVVSALDWILASAPEVRVVNMSFAIGNVTPGACDAQQPALAAAIRKLHDRGVFIVGASGNDGSTAGMRAPACIARTVSVGAVWDADLGRQTLVGCTDAVTASDRVACFSNTDPSLDLLAPGALITSAGAKSTAVNAAGTSFAAPHVTAAAALLLQVSPTLTPLLLEELLKNTGRPVVDPRTGRITPRVDVYPAVLSLQQPPSQSRRRPVRRGGPANE